MMLEGYIEPYLTCYIQQTILHASLHDYSHYVLKVRDDFSDSGVFN
jgi:hypothetical protein